MNNSVSIIILNYNSPLDTIECLKSVLKICCTNYHIVVVDNNSVDDSVNKISNWVEISLESTGEKNYFFTPQNNKIEYIIFKKDQIEEEYKSTAISIINAQNNYGYAAGNNLGLLYSIEKNNSDFYWILNNDTIVDPSALHFLVKSMQQNPQVGICGSVLIDYYQPGTIQAIGGRYNQFLGKISMVWKGYKISDIPKEKLKIDYPVGASMLVRKKIY